MLIGASRLQRVPASQPGWAGWGRAGASHVPITESSTIRDPRREGNWPKTTQSGWGEGFWAEQAGRRGGAGAPLTAAGRLFFSRGSAHPAAGVGPAAAVCVPLLLPQGFCATPSPALRSGLGPQGPPWPGCHCPRGSPRPLASSRRLQAASSLCLTAPWRAGSPSVRWGVLRPQHPALPSCHHLEWSWGPCLPPRLGCGLGGGCPRTLSGTTASDDFLRVNGSPIMSPGSSQGETAQGETAQGAWAPVEKGLPAGSGPELHGGAAPRLSLAGAHSRVPRASPVMWPPFLSLLSTPPQWAGLSHLAARSPTPGLGEGPC